MAASFNQEGIIVTTITSPVAQADSMYPALLNPNSHQLKQVPRYIQKFRKGEQKALGVVQIMLGIIQVTFGVPLVYAVAIAAIIGIPWWTGVLYIISGALSVSLEKIPKKSLMVGGLVMNILSVIAAGIGMVVYTFELLLGPLGRTNFVPLEAFNALVSCLLVFTILEFAISMATAVFNCHGLRCCEPDDELNSTVIQTATAQNYLAQEPQDVNYESLLYHDSDYQNLTFK